MSDAEQMTKEEDQEVRQEQEYVIKSPVMGNIAVQDIGDYTLRRLLTAMLDLKYGKITSREAYCTIGEYLALDRSHVRTETMAERDGTW